MSVKRQWHLKGSSSNLHKLTSTKSHQCQERCTLCTGASAQKQCLQHCCCLVSWNAEAAVLWELGVKAHDEIIYGLSLQFLWFNFF